MKSKSKLGWVLALIYLVVSAYLLATQGVFGESFIALILGLPWSLAFAFFEYGGVEGGALAYLMVLGPIILNAIILYCIGSCFGRKKPSSTPPPASPNV